MNRLEETLDDFQWEVYDEIAANIAKIDPTNIDEELQRQALTYSNYYGLMALCKGKLRDEELDLEVFDARTKHDEYTRKTEAGEKITEKIMEAFVFSRPDYKNFVKQVSNRKSQHEMLKGLVGSLSQRKDALIQISSNARAEKNMYS